MLVCREFDDSLFDVVEALLVLVVHCFTVVDLFAEGDNIILYPLIVFELL
jgi:hypothetical protein